MSKARKLNHRAKLNLRLSSIEASALRMSALTAELMTQRLTQRLTQSVQGGCPDPELAELLRLANAPAARSKAQVVEVAS